MRDLSLFSNHANKTCIYPTAHSKSQPVQLPNPYLCLKPSMWMYVPIPDLFFCQGIQQGLHSVTVNPIPLGPGCPCITESTPKQPLFVSVIIFNKILNVGFTAGDSINLRDWIMLRNKQDTREGYSHLLQIHKRNIATAPRYDRFFSTGPEGQWIWMTLGEGNMLSLKLKIHRRERLDSKS